MIRVLIADDERLARERLKRLLKSHHDVEVVGEAASGRESLELAAQLQPDAVLLDIEMPELTGVEVALAFSGKEWAKSRPAVIFVTAYNEYAVKAFEAEALDYLVKPIEDHRLDQALTRLRERVARKAVNTPKISSSMPAFGLESLSPTRLAVRVGSTYVICPFSEVSCLVAADDYVEVYAGEKKLLADDTLEGFAGKLTETSFIRIHRSVLINAQFVRELRRDGDRKYTVILNDHWQNEWPVSREKLDEVRKKLGLG